MSPAKQKYVLSLLELDDFADAMIGAADLAVTYGPDIYRYLKELWQKYRGNTEPLS